MARLNLSLEHKVTRGLRTRPLPRRWLLAVSGGLDSMVLAQVLWRWRRSLKIELAVAHVHHGTEGGEYRDRAQALVRSWCRAQGVRFLSLQPRPRGLRSEADLRRFRHATLERWRRKHVYDLIVFAHHRDDLLETRVLRLIRGTGQQGLRAMSALSGRKLRPLLEIGRAELEAYARDSGIQWIEDPSNDQPILLRNWLRHEWLPRLEARCAGSMASLARSLEVLAPGASVHPRLGAFVGLRRKELMLVPAETQRALVVQYLRALGLKGYGRDHVLEVLKRLGARRKEFEFEMLGFRFRATPDLLWASRV